MTSDVGTFLLHDHLPADHLHQALRRDVLKGLTATPKILPPKWFYDATGSALFEQITELAEYYPTRVERTILLERAGELAGRTGAGTLVELGAGSAAKTRLLLDALTGTGTLRRYVPVDVDAGTLAGTGAAILAEYPELTVAAVVADFEVQLGSVFDAVPAGPDPTLVAFLGSTIGNLEPGPRGAFLRGLRSFLRPGDFLLLGVDLVKDPAVLVAAYDDAAGVTAEFNRNVLAVVNNALTADFDLGAFDHVALWDPQQEWIEMRLRSVRDQEVRVKDLELTVAFGAGEQLRTEVSAKFRRDGVTAELAVAGFTLGDWWTDRAGRFALAFGIAA